MPPADPAPVSAQDLPTLPASLIWPTRIFLFLGALLMLGLLVQPLGDPDVFIHLRDGRYLWEHHFQVSHEPFSYTAENQPFETAEWLFRVCAYLTWRAGGYNLLILIKSLAMTAAVFLLGLLAYRRWPNLAVVSGLLALAVLAPMARLFPERPYVATYLLLPLVLLLLDDFRRSAAGPLNPGAERRLWLIPVAIVPWANLHPGFMVVFGFLGAHGVREVWEAWRIRQAGWRRVRLLSLVGIAGLFAGCLTPDGIHLYTFTLGMLGSNEFMRYILEWVPPTLSGEPVFFLLLGLAWLAQVLNLRRAWIEDVLPLLAFSVMALQSYRNIPLLVIAAVPPLAGNLRDLWSDRFPAWRLAASARRRALIAGSAGLALGFGVLLGYGEVFQFGTLPGFYPGAGMTWLLRHPFQGRLLTHDIWGGYTGWVTHGKIKIFMDGRLPTFGEKLYADYRKMIWGDAEACLPLLDQYRIEGILVSPKNEMRLFQRLWASKTWQLVYWDDVCLLYLRQGGQNAAWADALAYRSVEPKRNPFYDPAKPLQALMELKRAQAEAPQSFLPQYFEGDLALRFNQLAIGRQALLKALARAPEHLASHLDLGIIAARQQNYAEAESQLRYVMRHGHGTTLQPFATYELALLLSLQPARGQEARQLAQTVHQALPDWPPAAELVKRLQ
jgi:hypothetical protein